MSKRNPSPVTDPAGFRAALQKQIDKEVKAAGKQPKRGAPRTGIVAAGPVINSPVQSDNTGVVEIRTGLGRIFRRSN
jgi:hypothetical protein